MKKQSLIKRLSLAAASALALLLGGFTDRAQAASFDPAVTGDWDFYLSGTHKGVAHMTFLANNTVSGVQILMPGKVPKVQEATDRGRSVDPGNPRGGATSNTNGALLEVGGDIIRGFWGYDSRGKLLAAVTLTNTSWTNGISIRGTGKTGKYMTLRATRNDTGKTIIYHGVPRAVLPDISGVYFVSGKKTKQFTRDSEPFAELMTLTASATSFPSGMPNFYDVVRYGPGYISDNGFAILTANKQLGIYSEHQTPGTFTSPDGLVITSLSGPFKANKLTGKISGFDGTNFYSLSIGISAP